MIDLLLHHVYQYTVTLVQQIFRKIICFIVISVLSILNSHYLIGYTIDDNGYCNIKRYKWYEANYSRLNVVYLLSYSIIPFTIIAICNIFIVLTVCQNKTKMRKKYDMKKRPSCHHDQNLTPNGSMIISKVLQCSADNSPVNEKKHEMFATVTNTKVLNNSPVNEKKHEMFATIKEKKVLNNLLDSNCKVYFLLIFKI